jgi:CDP-diacylglycerol--glycerol-3-phosphate 3-phosphatidyltransferase
MTPSDPRAVGRRAPSAWNLPNYLTVVRFLLVPVFGWLLLAGGGQVWAYRLAALAVFGVAMVTDSIDGDLARRRGLVTDFGTVADPIADKALMGMALVGLSMIGLVPWWVTAVILVREVGITVMRFVVIRHGVMPAGRGGKAKTALQTVAVALLIFPLEALPAAAVWLTVAYVVLAAALVVTVATGVDYLLKARRLVATSARTAAARAARRTARDASRPGGARSAGPEKE